MDTVIGQMAHTSTSNSPTADKVLKSILKEWMSTEVVKKSKEIPASVSGVTATSVTTGDATVTNPTPAVTTSTAAKTLKGLGQPLQ